ncbi:MAG TPA: PQQ-binding-like beta-propeller repeat protein [Dehalococcoidales bacterium]|nr:PQQ-binding-like beta-propeller repeat protein [Dehalococcoidales bacterium]
MLIIVLVMTGCTMRGMTPEGWSGVAISQDGSMAFTGSREGRLVAINLIDSSRYFSEPLRQAASGGACGTTGMLGCGAAVPAVAIYGTPALADGVPIGLDSAGKPVLGQIVIVAGYNGVVVAYQSNALANVVWQFTVPSEQPSPIVGGVLVYKDLAYFGSSDGRVYALKVAGDLASRTTNMVWSFPTGNYIWGTPAVANDILVVGSFDKKIYGLNALTGDKIWEFTTGANNVATPLIVDGVVYVGSLDSTFYALDLQTGDEKWSFKAGNWFWAKAVMANDIIFAPSMDNKVYAFDIKTGSKINEYDLGGQISSNPVIIKGKVIVATQNKTLWSIDSTNPQTEARKIADIPADVSSPLTALGDIVFINGLDVVNRAENKLFGYNVATGAVSSPISLNY